MLRKLLALLLALTLFCSAALAEFSDELIFPGSDTAGEGDAFFEEADGLFEEADGLSENAAGFSDEALLFSDEALLFSGEELTLSDDFTFSNEAPAFFDEDAAFAGEAPAGAASGDNAALAAEIERLEQLVVELTAENDQLRVLLSGDANVGQLVAARFNGGVITVAEASAEYDYRAYFYDLLGMNSADYEDIIKTEVLEGLVQDAVLRLKAIELGVYEPTAEERTAAEEAAQVSFDSLVAYYMPYIARSELTEAENLAAVTEYLAGEGMTLASLIETELSESWRDRLQTIACAGYTVTDAELETYYLAACQSAEISYMEDVFGYENAVHSGGAVLWHPEGVRSVSRLLIAFDEEHVQQYQAILEATENTEDETMLAGLLAETEALYDTLDVIVNEVSSRIDAGDDFNLLLDEYGEDDYMATEFGRQTGYCVVKESEMLDPDMVENAMALEKIGDISGPFRCAEGVYFLRYERDVPAGPISLEEIRENETLLAAVTESAVLENWYAVVEQWMAEAEVEYFPENF